MLTADDIKALTVFHESGSVSTTPPLFWERIDAYLNARNIVHNKVPSNCRPCLVYAANAAYTAHKNEEAVKALKVSKKVSKKV